MNDQTAPNETPTVNRAILQDCIVLVVDDVEDNLMVASVTLEFQGAQVVTATNGVQGLAFLVQFKPSFVLLDLSMPVMDGWEMFRRMRSTPDWATIPVIALTAHAMIEDRARVKAAGFDGYITKPFDVPTFASRIREIIDHIGSA